MERLRLGESVSKQLQLQPRGVHGPRPACFNCIEGALWAESASLRWLCEGGLGPLTGHLTKTLVWRQKADLVEEVYEVLGSE